MLTGPTSTPPASLLGFCSSITTALNGNMEGDGSGVNNGQVTSIQSVQEEFDNFDIDIVIAWLCIFTMDISMHTREPIRDSVLLGPKWVREVLCGHSNRVYEAFRMERHVFLNLCGLMID